MVVVTLMVHTLIINENLLYLNRLLEGQVWFALFKRVSCSCAKPSHYLLITKEFNRWVLKLSIMSVDNDINGGLTSLDEHSQN